jgi:hypothetical protein
MRSSSQPNCHFSQVFFELASLIVTLYAIADVVGYSLSDVGLGNRDRGSFDGPGLAPEDGWKAPGEEWEQRSKWEWQILLAFLVAPVGFNFLLMLFAKFESFGIHHGHFFRDYDGGICMKFIHGFFGLLNVEAINWPYGHQSVSEKDEFKEERHFAYWSFISDLFHLGVLLDILVCSKMFRYAASSDVKFSCFCVSTLRRQKNSYFCVSTVFLRCAVRSAATFVFRTASSEVPVQLAAFVFLHCVATSTDAFVFDMRVNKCFCVATLWCLKHKLLLLCLTLRRQKYSASSSQVQLPLCSTLRCHKYSCFCVSPLRCHKYSCFCV